MIRCVWLARALCLFAGTLLAEPDIQVLIITGRDHHDWQSTTPYLRKLLTDTGRFAVRVEEEPAGITPATLAKYDLAVLHYNGPRWGDAAEKTLLDFVRSGKGVVAAHAATYTFAGLKTQGHEHDKTALIEPPRTEYWKLLGAHWDLSAPGTGHAGRKVFTVKFTNPAHPITRGLEPFRIGDELYHNLRTEPGNEVLATAYDDPRRGGTGKDERQMWTRSYGSGRVFYTALGHDLGSMQGPAFGRTFTRAAEWAATGKVAPQPANPPVKQRLLVVTGGHDFETSFYTLFEDFDWKHAISNREAFKSDIRPKYDVLVLYDMEDEISDQAKQNFQQFAESGKGIVVLHHAICGFNSWQWYKDLVGGSYPRRTGAFKHGQDLVVRPVAWISPYPKSRVVYIQLGHDHRSQEHPNYRTLVKNAILWSSGKLP
jgi:type 1 glutamine amidotransferase